MKTRKTRLFAAVLGVGLGGLVGVDASFGQWQIQPEQPDSGDGPREHSDQDSCGTPPESPQKRVRNIGGTVGVIFVNAAAGGRGTGRCWIDAFTDLQDALDVARQNPTAGREIWLATGVYRPDRGTGDRTASFELVDGVPVYGGFGGWETLRSRRLRNPDLNGTVLSGDLLGNDQVGSRTDNSFHVVTSNGNTVAAVLDGVTITGGNADGSGIDASGAGLLIEWANPVLRRVVFDGNHAANAGGAIFVESGSPRLRGCRIRNNTASDGAGMYSTGDAQPDLRRCTFSSNFASGNGGALLIAQGSHPTLLSTRFLNNTASIGAGMLVWSNSGVVAVNSILSGNLAMYGGGAVVTEGSSMDLTNSTLLNNRAVVIGGGVSASLGADLVLCNSIVWANSDGAGAGSQAAGIYLDTPATVLIQHSCIEGWDGSLGGVGNIGSDPMFASVENTQGREALALLPGSPCIDAGDSDATVELTLGIYGQPITVDAGGNPRFINDPATPGTPGQPTGQPPIDLGAFEFVPLEQIHDDDD